MLAELLPGSSTNNAIATFSGTAGTALLSGTALLDSSGNFTAVNSIANAVGSAAAPSYTFTAETNTGIYSSAANTLDFATDGTRQVSVGGAVVAVNYITLKGSVASSPVLIGAAGTDTSVSVEIVPKGSGNLNVLTGNINALAGNVIAGASGAAGTVTSYPATASEGSLILAAVSNATGNFTTTISNAAAVAQSQVVTIPDGGAATSTFLLNSGVQTFASGAKLTLDKGTGTESAGAVTISHQTGVITSTSLTTAAGSTHTITLTNTLIATTSVVLVSLMGGSNTTIGVQLSATAANGSSVITVSNNNASSALNGTLIIGFAVF